MRIRFILLLSLTLLPAKIVWSETVLLRNGSRIVGKILTQDRDSVHVRVSGKVQVIRKAAVARILYRNPDPVDKKVPSKTAPSVTPKPGARSTPPAAKSVAKELPAKNTALAPSVGPILWRALLLPGWGSVYQGQTTQGYLWGGGFLLAAMGNVRAAGGTASARDHYAATASSAFLFSPAVLSTAQPGTVIYAHVAASSFLLSAGRTAEVRSRVHSAGLRERRAQGLLAAVYLGSVADAVLWQPANGQATLRADPASNAYALAFSFSF